jgi:hypothetical protein
MACLKQHRFKATEACDDFQWTARWNMANEWLRSQRFGAIDQGLQRDSRRYRTKLPIANICNWSSLW